MELVIIPIVILRKEVTERWEDVLAQLAKLVAIYSPWQFVYWYDRPEKSPRRAGGAGSAESVIKTDAATRFYNSIPTVWGETRFLEGEWENMLWSPAVRVPIGM